MHPGIGDSLVPKTYFPLGTDQSAQSNGDTFINIVSTQATAMLLYLRFDFTFNFFSFLLS